MELIFLLVAVICFGLAAFGVAFRLNLIAAGLFFFAMAFLWPHLFMALR